MTTWLDLGLPHVTDCLIWLMTTLYDSAPLYLTQHYLILPKTALFNYGLPNCTHDWFISRLIWLRPPDLIRDCLIWFMKMYLLHNLLWQWSNTFSKSFYIKRYCYYIHFGRCIFTIHVKQTIIYITMENCASKLHWLTVHCYFCFLFFNFILPQQ